MSRYLLLLLLNLPFVLAGILSAITAYKLSRSSKKRMVAQLFIWSIILLGLMFAEPLYQWLFSHNLTVSEPLSLFDVVQITAIVVTFYIANRTRARTLLLERRLQDIHQELSLKLSRPKD